EDENAEDVQMADHLRPMEELLRIPILGIENAIVVPAVLADQFELKPELLDFETSNQLMQNQMGQIEEIFQERQSCVLPSITDPRAELHEITSMDGLTLDGSFIPHSLVYQEKEQEPETITEVVEIPSS
ncbi:hypothetical protein Tco_1544161, partial [Tanacetum coccineum]